MGIAGAILFSAAALQQAGIQYTTAGNAGFITSLSVVIVPFVLLVGRRERPRWKALVAVVMAGSGAYLLSTGGSFELRKGDALELIVALFWSLHFVVLGKFALRFPAIQFAAGQFLVAGLLNFIAGLFLEQPFFNLPFAGAIMFTAIFSVGIGYPASLGAALYPSVECNYHP
jgi:drug/metabolite transporter (DMT)-like permease